MKAYSTHNPILVLSLAAIAGLAPAIAVRAEPQSPALASPSSEMLPPEPATGSAIDRQLLNAAADFSTSDAALESQSTLFAQTEPLAPVNPTESPAAEVQPAPETPIVEVATSAEALQLPAVEPLQSQIVQRRSTEDRRLLLNDPYSYIGIGGNIGITDSGNGTTEKETPIGKGSFVVNGKIGIGPSLSLRPAIIVNNDVAFLIPITYDFRIPTRDPLEVSPFIPFIGGGLAVTSTDDNHLGFLVTGGVDYRISPQWTANGSLNVGFMSDTTDIGVILGIGYTFPGFGF
ncbi:hypothetical protein [Oscillatoria sp. FACHB-1406]|uniref:outer membrane protein n=1 Tax=Oscillatoria sp. FACHB-1406 TaxID=2692846 RepID=UPI00168A10BE|nr:hypothetical protein [Oscillatoria sp. FACHB-1406]MBD2578435.1 hypothetical protein [Oscillatoria sp. FACHB-1406]